MNKADYHGGITASGAFHLAMLNMLEKITQLTELKKIKTNHYFRKQSDGSKSGKDNNNTDVEEDSTSSFVFRPTTKPDYHPDM